MTFSSQCREKTNQLLYLSVEKEEEEVRSEEKKKKEEEERTS